MFVSCSENQNKPEINITTTVSPSDGLDLKLVGALIQDGKCKDAQSLEDTLNKPNGINNLDLDNDKSIDYINVTENDSKGNQNAKSFDLTTGKEDNVTHIATIEVQKVGNEYQINMAGNQQVYGNNCNYTSHCGPTFGEMMFCMWLFQPRPMWHHPYYYGGYYPSYYGRGYVRPVVVQHNVYVQRTTTIRQSTKNITPTKTSSCSVKSPNINKCSSSTRTSINNHQQSMKAMSTRSSSSPVSKGGFSSKSSSSSSSSRPSSSSSSYRSSSSSSSRSSFSSGGSRRCDSTFKENIQVLLDDSSILKLKAVTFNYKDKKQYGNKTYIGFLAQDVQKIIPNAVYKDSLGLMLDYEQIVPVLVKQVQTQQKEIDTLKNNNEHVLYYLVGICIILFLFLLLIIKNK
jgi:hypothetical protein